MNSKNYLNGKRLEKALLTIKPKHLYPEFSPRLFKLIDKSIPNSHISTFENENWRLSSINITEQQALVYNISERSSYKDRISLRPRYVRPGKYNVLFDNENRVVMSDTPVEKAEHYIFVKNARGNVLIAGLGIGMVAWATALKPEVKTVTVIEKSLDLILVFANECRNNSFYKDRPEVIEKISIIHNDINTYLNNLSNQERDAYTTAWFDIWNDISDLNLKEMNSLMGMVPATKFRGCWAYNQTIYMKFIYDSLERAKQLKRKKEKTRG